MISSWLKVGYLNFGALLVDSLLERKMRTLQSSRLTLLFCNILLHELDFFVISLCKDMYRPLTKETKKNGKFVDTT